MTIHEVVQGEVPVLRTECEPITEFDEQLHQLLDDLWDTVGHYRGFGLAAPQIAVTKQATVIDIGEEPIELINPEILTEVGSQRGMESCLSFPDMAFDIERPLQITLRAQNRDGHPFELEASGLLARVICHEVDHLHGVLLFDHLSEGDIVAQIFEQMSADAMAMFDTGMDLDTDMDMDEDMDEEANPLASTSARDDANADSHNNSSKTSTSYTLSSSDDANPNTDNDANTNVDDDIRLALDLLGDAVWKLELAIELLQEHHDRVEPILPLDALKGIASQLFEHVETAEQLRPAW